MNESYTPIFEELEPISATETVEFPEDVFPEKLNKYLKAVSVSKQAKFKIPATYMIGLLSVMFQKSYKVRLKPGFIVSLSSYGAVSAKPASGKTTTLNEMSNDFYKFEKELNQRLSATRLGTRIDKSHLERKKEKLEKEYDKDGEEKTRALLIENEQALEKCDFNNVCLFIDEFTPEAYYKNMNEQFERLAIVSDDARDFFSELSEGKYNKNSKMTSPLLKAFNCGKHTVDRKGDESKRIELNDMHTTIVLSMQPDILKKAFNSPQNFESGIISRFLFTHDEDLIVKKFTSSDIPHYLREWYSESVKKCLEKSFKNRNPESIICEFDDKSSVIIKKLANKLNAGILEVSDEKISWQQRAIDHTATIAALFALWDNIVEKGLEKDEHIISINHLNSAFKTVNYFSKMFDAISESGGKLYNDSVAILNHIKKNKWEYFTRQNINTIFPKYGKATSELLKSRLRFLQDKGYISIGTYDKETSPNTFKKVERIYVNPEIYGRELSIEEVQSGGKLKYAEFVFMTESEYVKLVEKFGESGVGRCIEILDNYKGSTGKTYVSDYRAILNWVIKRHKEEKDNPQSKKKPSLARQSDNPSFDVDAIERQIHEEMKEMVRETEEKKS